MNRNRRVGTSGVRAVVLSLLWMSTASMSAMACQPTTTALRQVPGRGASIVIAAANASDEWAVSSDVRCDGVADDVELNAAIATLNSRGGGSILLSDGTFQFNDHLRMQSHIRLIGQGASTVLYRPEGLEDALIQIGTNQERERHVAIEQLRIQRDVVLCVGSNAIRAVNVEHLSVVSCAFELTSSAILMSGVTGGTITGCSFDTVNNAILMNGASSIVISNNRAREVGVAPCNGESHVGHFVYVGSGSRGQDERDIVITGNQVNSGRGDGIVFFNSSGNRAYENVTIAGNTITGFDGSAIFLTSQVRRCTIDGNTISASSKGVYINGTDITARVTDNFIEGCVEGIFIGQEDDPQPYDDSRRIDVISNTMSNNTIGAFISNTQRVRFASNTLRDNNANGAAAIGLYLSQAVDGTVVENNTFERHGVEVGLSAHIVGIVSAVSLNPVLRDNTFYGVGMGQAAFGNEQGLVFSTSLTDLLICSGNLFFGFASVQDAVGPLRSYADYSGTRVYTNGVWMTLEGS